MCLSCKIQWVFLQERKVLRRACRVHFCHHYSAPRLSTLWTCSAPTSVVLPQVWHSDFLPLCSWATLSRPPPIILSTLHISHDNLTRQINFLPPFHRYFIENSERLRETKWPVLEHTAEKRPKPGFQSKWSGPSVTPDQNSISSPSRFSWDTTGWSLVPGASLTNSVWKHF